MSEIMSDQDLVKVLMEEICEKAVDKQIPRPELINIIRSLKLDCKDVNIEAFLVRKKLIEVQHNGTRGIYKINYVAEPKIEPKPVIEPEPKPEPVKPIEAIEPVPILVKHRKSAAILDQTAVVTEEDIIKRKEEKTTLPTNFDITIALLKKNADKYSNISMNVSIIDKKIEAHKTSIKSLEEEKQIILTGASKYKEAFDSYNQIQEIINKHRELALQG